MNQLSLLEEMSKPSAYLFEVQAVDVRQTHISVVFLTEDLVYKVRKPVRFAFLDFTSLELRRADCEREVVLNQRLAPGVYLGVVPIVRQGDRIVVEGDGEVIEWAVKMQRLPDSATLQQYLLRGEIDSEAILTLGQRLAQFHNSPKLDPRFAELAGFEAVSKNALENLLIQRETRETIFDNELFERLVKLTRQHLERHRGLIGWRAESGVPRDTHGDLRLDHIYLFPDRDPPDDVVIIDCVEFNDAFRYADPVSDLAFLVMDLKFHGWTDVARQLTASYFDASGDSAGERLLPLYVAYRAAVRAKVNILKMGESDVPDDERQRAADHAHAHWMLALSELSTPTERPCLILIGGLPGTGKSTLAKELAASANMNVIRSDVIRKQLAGFAAESSAAAAPHAGIYSAEWTNRAYEECLRQAVQALKHGGRVIVDATFSKESQRQEFLAAARRLAIPCLFFECRLDPQIARHRLEHRAGDASDANWPIYQAVSRSWEPPGHDTLKVTRIVDTGDSGGAIAMGMKAMHDAELFVRSDRL